MCDVCEAAEKSSGDVTERVAVNWGPVSMGVAAVMGSSTLRDYGDELFQVAMSLADAAHAKYEQHNRVTDSVTKEALWRERNELWTEYNVVLGWSHAFKAAARFQQYGAATASFPDAIEYDMGLIDALQEVLTDQK